MAAPVDRMEVGKFVFVKPKYEAEYRVVEPFARSGHCCATNGTNLFVFGGYHPEYELRGSEPETTIYNEVFTEMWCFNLATETWREVKTIGDGPHETASMSMLLSGHTMLLFGGTTYPWGITSNKEVIAFKLKDKAWSTLECTGERPPGKYGQAMLLRHGCLYLFGGCHKVLGDEFVFDSDVHRLDLGKQTWSLLSDEAAQCDPEAPSRGMYRHGLAWHGDKLYIIGCSWRDLSSFTHQDKVHVYNLGTNTWDKETAKPCPIDGCPRQRKYNSCVQWKNEVYICGGHNHSIIFGDIWMLELPSLQWHKIQVTMPVPSFFHSAAITPSKCMYIFGGVTCLEDGTRTKNLYRIWLNIPSLQEISFKRVLSLLPSGITNADKFAKLGELGVPRNILERLKHVE